MAAPNPVKVLEVCRVAPTPSSPDSAAPTSLPLTFFDVLYLRFPPVKRIFFYETSHSTTTFSEIVLPKLKHSLSLTLHHYLPLAGNLTWSPDSDKPIIQYVEGHDAISLTIAESEAESFYHLSGDSSREAKEFHHYLPQLVASHTQVPVMALQVTLFPNTGFSIGYAIHHAVLDGKTISLFMHSWASICLRGQVSTLTPELTPFYDRNIVDDPDDLETTFLNGWLQQNGNNNKSLMTWDLKAPPDVFLATFRLTQANIENIKKRVQAQWQEKNNHKLAIPLSTFTITSAYTWVCLLKTLKMRSQKVRLIIGVDCRARLEPPLPSTYFGNCITGCMVDADSNDLIGEDGLTMAATAIGEAIQGLNDGVLKGAKDCITTLLSSQKEALISIAGSPRLEMYNIDFGWGRPRKVEVTSIDKSGAFSLADSRDGNGGLQIGIVLKKHEIEAFASLFASGLETH
ncbi:hypothetical protein ACSBR2_040443 [Camellia fascicularis]